MIIRSRGIDPLTGEPDRHGIPQIACPACEHDVNPQFTCRECPCAFQVETHTATDDRGDLFHLVDAVDCGFAGKSAKLAALWHSFPNLLTGVVEGAKPRVEGGVACPLLAQGERFVPVFTEWNGARWVPLSHCHPCQFHQGTQGELKTGAPGDEIGLTVACTAPVSAPDSTTME